MPESKEEASEEGARPDPGSDGEVWRALDAAVGGRYRIDALVDRGGMGMVFSALDQKHSRRVAIKTISPGDAAGLTPRFVREIQITARMQHPNILPLLDSGVAEGMLYYIMPYVEGESLQSRLDRTGRLPPGEAVNIALEIASGLDHAHRRGILHRDMKPSNVLLADGHAQIVDFGIAQMVVELDGQDLTESGVLVGTPRYMAPEQLAGESTVRSDVYALGAVVYEALTGRVWRSEVASGELSWLHVPARIQPVIARALEVRPADRWRDMSEFARALGESLDSPSEPDRGSSSGGPGLLARLRQWLGEPSESVHDRKSIAVLPFDNLNRDEETEYFSDGITEDIIAHVARIRDLKVISRTSVMRYKGSQASISEIGKALNVGSILEGSVRRIGDRVRVVSQLIDARSDQHLWSETFDRSVTDIFEIQSDIAQRIAQALEAQISDAERSLIRRRPTEDVEAHDLYLKGRHLWSRRTRAALASAEEQFRRAVARDPLFAPAYAGLGDVYLLEGSYGYREELEALDKARTAIDRALVLDEDLAEGHASHGQILRADRDWEAEERAYRRAIELNPNYATAYQWFATLLAAMGRAPEALAHIDRACELDPLSHAIRVTSGIVRFVSRDFDGALADFRRTRELEPRFFSVAAWLVELWSEIGAFDRALEEWERLRELHPDPRVILPSRSCMLAAAGRQEEALEVLHAYLRKTPDNLLAGVINAQVGEIDQAFEYLKKELTDPSWRMFVLHRSGLFYLKVHPWFDPLRGDPRFRHLLRLMNMEARADHSR